MVSSQARSLTTVVHTYPAAVNSWARAAVGVVAAGAATFKYGTTRKWVESLTVILAAGDVLDLNRGETRAHPDGYFELALSRGTVRVPVPAYKMPTVDKLSAGYYAEPGMDLIDLFVGSEGTLGVITETTLRIIPVRPAFCLAFVTFERRPAALEFVRRLRDAARTTWARADPRGIDVSAIEHMDARSLQLLREDGLDRQHAVNLPDDTALAVLVTLDLPADMTRERGYAEIGSAGGSDAPDTPLVRFCALLAEFGVTEHTVIALPGDRAQTALTEIREAVPAAVNRRVGLSKRNVDGRIEKTAADMIVPFEQFETLLHVLGVAVREGGEVALLGRRGLRGRGLRGRGLGRLGRRGLGLREGARREGGEQDGGEAAEFHLNLHARCAHRRRCSALRFSTGLRAGCRGCPS